MTTIMPQSELLRKAAVYVENERQNTQTADSSAAFSALLEEAAMRFNLSPLEDRMLRNLFAASPSAVSDAAKSSEGDR